MKCDEKSMKETNENCSRDIRYKVWESVRREVIVLGTDIEKKDAVFNHDIRQR